MHLFRFISLIVEERLHQIPVVDVGVLQLIRVVFSQVLSKLLERFKQVLVVDIAVLILQLRKKNRWCKR